MTAPDAPSTVPAVESVLVPGVYRRSLPSSIARLDRSVLDALSPVEMLELEVLPESGLASDQIEFLLGE